jgi:MFS family permease
VNTATATATLRADVKVIGLVSVAHMFSHFFQLVIPPLFLYMRDSFGTSYTELGFAMAAFYVASGAMQIPAGFLVDRLGGRVLMLSGLGMLATGILLVGFAPSLPWMVAALIIAGMGNSVFHPADLAILNQKIDPRRLGHAFSVHGLGGNLGWIIAPLFSISVAAAFGWRSALIAAGGGGLIAVAFLMTQEALGRNELPERRDAARRMAGADGVSVLRSWPIVACFLFFFLSAVALIGFQTYAIPVFERLYHAPLVLASAALTAFLAGGAAGFIAGGFVASATERHGRVAFGGALAAAALFLLMASGVLPLWALLVAATITGFLASFISPSRDIIVRAAAPAHARGKAYGFVYSGLDLGSAVAPAVFGWMMDQNHVAGVFVAVALSMGLASLMVAEAGRPRATAAT